jgi:hypothetical protein
MPIRYGDGTTSNTGRIIRIIQQTHNSEGTSTNISNWTNCPFPTLVVTPESTSSKFLLMCSFGYGIIGSTSCAFRWRRNNATIGAGSDASFVVGGTGNNSWRETVSHIYMDTPSTTSSITYRLQFRPYDSGRTIYWNNTPSGGGIDDYNARASFQLIELAS